MSLSKRTLAISVAAVLGVAAVGTYGLVSSAGASQQPAAAPAATPVDVAPVLAKNVSEWDEFSGRIEAVQRVEVRPLVSGTVTAVHFKDGSIVKKGDALFTIDPRPYAAEVARTQAALTAAKSRVAYTKYCSDTKHRHWLMPQMERCAAMPNIEVAHLALDAARVQAPTTAHAAPARDLGQQGLAPGRQTLRGKRPQLAASCA